MRCGSVPESHFVPRRPLCRRIYRKYFRFLSPDCSNLRFHSSRSKAGSPPLKLDAVSLKDPPSLQWYSSRWQIFCGRQTSVISTREVRPSVHTYVSVCRVGQHEACMYPHRGWHSQYTGAGIETDRVAEAYMWQRWYEIW